MIKFENIEYKPTQIHNSEFVDFGENGHGKLKNIPVGSVYTSIDEYGSTIKIHSVGNVVYNKSFSNRKIQVFYKMIIKAKTINLKVEDYPFELELGL